MSFWEKINPFKRVTHCHVPIIAGHTATMDIVGGIVTGMVEHPFDDGLVIEFTGVVVGSTMDNDLFEEYLDAIDEAQKVLNEKVEEIQSESEVAEDNQLLESFNPETDMTMEMELGLVFSFWEGEDAGITAYGHRDKEEFAAEIQRYDDYQSGMRGSSQHPESEIDHRWGRAVLRHGEIEVQVCDRHAPGAFPITIVWNAR